MTDALGAGSGMGRAFPADDPQRRVLHDEVHARPPVRILTPERVAHLALRVVPEARGQEARSIAELAAFLGVAAPAATATFAWLEGSALRVKWERHTEGHAGGAAGDGCARRAAPRVAVGFAGHDDRRGTR